MSEVQALGLAAVPARSGVRRLRDNPAAAGAVMVLAALTLLSIVGPDFSPYS